MSYTQSAVRITSELSGASIKPEFEAEPVRVSFSSAVAIVVAAVGLIYLIAGVV